MICVFNRKYEAEKALLELSKQGFNRISLQLKQANPYLYILATRGRVVKAVNIGF